MKAEFLARYKLRAAQASFARKVDDAKRTIGLFLEQSVRPYVSWSGGKDSTCLMVLLAEIGRHDVEAFTQADDLDWPEKKEHCHRVVQLLGFASYEWRESKVSASAQFAAADTGDGISGTFSHVVSAYVSERQRDGAIIGIRKDESDARRKLRAARGKVFKAKDGWRCLPIVDWTGEDVFALIVSRGIPYMALYDCEALPPHEWRMSWPAAPAFWRSGSGAQLRRYFPEHFARLARLNPNLRNVT